MLSKPKFSPSSRFLITLTETDGQLTIVGHFVGEEESLAYAVGRDVLVELNALSADNVEIGPLFRSAHQH